MINVLNHGFVKLINSMGTDKSIVNSARVSYKGLTDDNLLTEKDEKLITSLVQRKHTSPFECVSFTFAVRAPLFVLRQWHRHRTWSYNEVSARYTELPELFYVPDPALMGVQMKHEKQMRDMDTDNPEAVYNAGLIEENNHECFNVYKDLLERNCPRELARTVLPVSVYSEMYATVNLHNLMHFLRLRCDEHSQYEIRVYADAMLELAKEVVPFTMDIFEKELNNE